MDPKGQHPSVALEKPATPRWVPNLPGGVEVATVWLIEHSDMQNLKWLSFDMTLGFVRAMQIRNLSRQHTLFWTTV